MRRCLSGFLIGLLWFSYGLAQPIEQVVQIMPLFASWTDVKARDNVLTIGVFSESNTDLKSTVDILSQSEYWYRRVIKDFIGHEKVVCVPLNSENLSDFSGEIIWVLQADSSLTALRDKAGQGIFTIGVQNPAFEPYLVATLTYEDESTNPKEERWKLTRFFGNCAITPLKFSYKLTTRDNFVGHNCETD